MLIGTFILIPYINDVYVMAENLTFFADLYANLFPNGYSYSWSQALPEAFWLTLGIMLALILWSKLLLYIIHRIARKVSKTNYLLAMSRLLIYVIFFYTLVNIFSLLFFTDIFAWFRTNVALSLVYDVLFVWLPFLIIYWFVEWVIVRVIRGKNF